MNVSVSALKRHKHAGHVAEAQQAHTEARSVADRVRELDAQVSELSFEGDLRQQAATVRDYGISVLRRARARGDDRTAIAATSAIQRSLEMLAELEKHQATSADGEAACPSVIVYPPELTQDGLDMLARQLPAVTVWLPDNNRGDGLGHAGGDAEIEP